MASHNPSLTSSSDGGDLFNLMDDDSFLKKIRSVLDEDTNDSSLNFLSSFSSNTLSRVTMPSSSSPSPSDASALPKNQLEASWSDRLSTSTLSHSLPPGIKKDALLRRGIPIEGNALAKKEWPMKGFQGKPRITFSALGRSEEGVSSSLPPPISFTSKDYGKKKLHMGLAALQRAASAKNTEFGKGMATRILPTLPPKGIPPPSLPIHEGLAADAVATIVESLPPPLSMGEAGPPSLVTPDLSFPLPATDSSENEKVALMPLTDPPPPPPPLTSSPLPSLASSLSASSDRAALSTASDTPAMAIQKKRLREADDPSPPPCGEEASGSVAALLEERETPPPTSMHFLHAHTLSPEPPTLCSMDEGFPLCGGEGSVKTSLSLPLEILDTPSSPPQEGPLISAEISSLPIETAPLSSESVVTASYAASPGVEWQEKRRKLSPPLLPEISSGNASIVAVASQREEFSSWIPPKVMATPTLPVSLLPLGASSSSSMTEDGSATHPPSSPLSIEDSHCAAALRARSHYHGYLKSTFKKTEMYLENEKLYVQRNVMDLLKKLAPFMQTEAEEMLPPESLTNSSFSSVYLDVLKEQLNDALWKNEGDIAILEMEKGMLMDTDIEAMMALEESSRDITPMVETTVDGFSLGILNLGAPFLSSPTSEDEGLNLPVESTPFLVPTLSCKENDREASLFKNGSTTENPEFLLPHISMVVLPTKTTHSDKDEACQPLTNISLPPFLKREEGEGDPKLSLSTPYLPPPFTSLLSLPGGSASKNEQSLPPLLNDSIPPLLTKGGGGTDYGHAALSSTLGGGLTPSLPPSNPSAPRPRLKGNSRGRKKGARGMSDKESSEERAARQRPPIDMFLLSSQWYTGRLDPEMLLSILPFTETNGKEKDGGVNGSGEGSVISSKAGGVSTPSLGISIPPPPFPLLDAFSLLSNSPFKWLLPIAYEHKRGPWLAQDRAVLHYVRELNKQRFLPSVIPFLQSLADVSIAEFREASPFPLPSALPAYHGHTRPPSEAMGGIVWLPLLPVGSGLPSGGNDVPAYADISSLLPTTPLSTSFALPPASPIEEALLSTQGAAWGDRQPVPLRGVLLRLRKECIPPAWWRQLPHRCKVRITHVETHLRGDPRGEAPPSASCAPYGLSGRPAVSPLTQNRLPFECLPPPYPYEEGDLPSPSSGDPATTFQHRCAQTGEAEDPPFHFFDAAACIVKSQQAFIQQRELLKKEEQRSVGEAPFFPPLQHFEGGEVMETLEQRTLLLSTESLVDDASIEEHIEVVLMLPSVSMHSEKWETHFSDPSSTLSGVVCQPLEAVRRHIQKRKKRLKQLLDKHKPICRDRYKRWKGYCRKKEKENIMNGDACAWGILPLRALDHPDLFVPLPAGFRSGNRNEPYETHARCLDALSRSPFHSSGSGGVSTAFSTSRQSGGNAASTLSSAASLAGGAASPLGVFPSASQREEAATHKCVHWTTPSTSGENITQGTAFLPPTFASSVGSAGAAGLPTIMSGGGHSTLPHALSRSLRIGNAVLTAPPPSLGGGSLPFLPGTTLASGRETRSSAHRGDLRASLSLHPPWPMKLNDELNPTLDTKEYKRDWMQGNYVNLTGPGIFWRDACLFRLSMGRLTNLPSPYGGILPVNLLLPDLDFSLLHEDVYCTYASFNLYVKNPLEVEHMKKMTSLWSTNEIRTFIERFLMYPKNFDKVAQFLEGKTSRDCVEFYYRCKFQFGLKKMLQELEETARNKKKNKNVSSKQNRREELVADVIETLFQDMELIPMVSFNAKNNLLLDTFTETMLRQRGIRSALQNPWAYREEGAQYTHEDSEMILENMKEGYFFPRKYRGFLNPGGQALIPSNLQYESTEQTTVPGCILYDYSVSEDTFEQKCTSKHFKFSPSQFRTILSMLDATLNGPPSLSIEEDASGSATTGSAYMTRSRSHKSTPFITKASPPLLGGNASPPRALSPDSTSKAAPSLGGSPPGTPSPDIPSEVPPLLASTMPGWHTLVAKLRAHLQWKMMTHRPPAAVKEGMDPPQDAVLTRKRAEEKEDSRQGVRRKRFCVEGKRAELSRPPSLFLGASKKMKEDLEDIGGKKESRRLHLEGHAPLSSTPPLLEFSTETASASLHRRGRRGMESSTAMPSSQGHGLREIPGRGPSDGPLKNAAHGPSRKYSPPRGDASTEDEALSALPPSPGVYADASPLSMALPLSFDMCFTSPTSSLVASPLSVSFQVPSNWNETHSFATLSPLNSYDASLCPSTLPFLSALSAAEGSSGDTSLAVRNTREDISISSKKTSSPLDLSLDRTVGMPEDATPSFSPSSLAGWGRPGPPSAVSVDSLFCPLSKWLASADLPLLDDKKYPSLSPSNVSQGIRRAATKWSEEEKHVYAETLRMHGRSWEHLSAALAPYGKTREQVKNFYQNTIAKKKHEVDVGSDLMAGGGFLPSDPRAFSPSTSTTSLSSHPFVEEVPSVSLTSSRYPATLLSPLVAPWSSESSCEKQSSAASGEMPGLDPSEGLWPVPSEEAEKRTVRPLEIVSGDPSETVRGVKKDLNVSPFISGYSPMTRQAAEATEPPPPLSSPVLSPLPLLLDSTAYPPPESLPSSLADGKGLALNWQSNPVLAVSEMIRGIYQNSSSRHSVSPMEDATTLMAQTGQRTESTAQNLPKAVPSMTTHVLVVTPQAGDSQVMVPLRDYPGRFVMLPVTSMAQELPSADRLSISESLTTLTTPSTAVTPLSLPAASPCSWSNTQPPAAAMGSGASLTAETHSHPTASSLSITQEELPRERIEKSTSFSEADIDEQVPPCLETPSGPAAVGGFVENSLIASPLSPLKTLASSREHSPCSMPLHPLVGGFPLCQAELPSSTEAEAISVALSPSLETMACTEETMASSSGMKRCREAWEGDDPNMNKDAILSSVQERLATEKLPSSYNEGDSVALYPEDTERLQ